VIGKGKTPLRHGRSGSVYERAFGAENGDVGHDWGTHGRRGSEVLTSGGGDEDVVGVDGDVFVKRGKEEGIEDFLSYLGGSGRHCCRERLARIASFIMLFTRVSFWAYSGVFHRSLRLDLEQTSPTPKPKSLLKGEILSIAQGTEGFGVFHGSKT
jgi:hypothetical protein